MKNAEIDIESQVQEALDLLPLFDVFLETYKTVNNHPIGAHILVPKKKVVGKRPLLVKLHGGGFHEGASDYAFRPW
jgi:cephalosporin-C deacetylase-like acetyl esterase